MKDRAFPLSQLKNTAHAVFAVDGCQRILIWNRAAETLLGRSADEVTGRQCYEVVDGRVASGKRLCRRGCPVIRRLDDRGLIRDFDLLVDTPDRPALPVTVCSVMLRRGSADGVIVHLLHPGAASDPSTEAVRQTALRLRSSLDALLANATQAPGPPDAVAALEGPLPRLSDREHDVLHALAAGLSVKAIGHSLGISPLTVRTHIRNLLRKTNLHSQVQLVLFAVRRGLNR